MNINALTIAISVLSLSVLFYNAARREVSLSGKGFLVLHRETSIIWRCERNARLGGETVGCDTAD
jgi:hypothetical protein